MMCPHEQGEFKPFRKRGINFLRFCSERMDDSL